MQQILFKHMIEDIDHLPQITFLWEVTEPFQIIQKTMSKIILRLFPIFSYSKTLPLLGVPISGLLHPTHPPHPRHVHTPCPRPLAS